jgi:hypothetical protein
MLKDINPIDKTPQQKYEGRALLKDFFTCIFYSSPDQGIRNRALKSG